MNIDTFACEFDSLSADRQKQGLKKIFDTLISDIDNHLWIIEDFLTTCSAYEADDGFGTEGLEV